MLRSFTTLWIINITMAWGCFRSHWTMKAFNWPSCLTFSSIKLHWYNNKSGRSNLYWYQIFYSDKDVFWKQFVGTIALTINCLHDKGEKFTGADFPHLLNPNGTQDVTTTIKNPQANGIFKCWHESVSNTLCLMLNDYPTITEKVYLWYIFDIAAPTSNIAIHYILNTSPGK